MRTAINIVAGMLALAAVPGCTSRELDRAAYVAYMEDADNGLKKTVEVEGWRYELQYKPADYMILKESKGKADRQSYAERRSRLDSTAWFQVSFKRKDGSETPLKYNAGSLEEYNARMDYYLNKAAADITLQYGGETIHPMSYWFETNYGLTPQETMIVAFRIPDKTPAKDMTLAYYDRIFRNGIIQAGYPARLTAALPRLKY